MGVWCSDERTDVFKIEDKRVAENANSVVAICKGNNLFRQEVGCLNLRIEKYGNIFSLDEQEIFHSQPTTVGEMATGVLVGEDLVIAAAHYVNAQNVTTLRFIFGFKMLDSYTPITKIPNENIYKGEKVIHRVYNSKEEQADWALVKLNRKVVGQSIARVSPKKIFIDQPVYAIGHPCGLPLKYAPGAHVSEVRDTCFFAGLDIYSGNSGSPVFDNETHEMLGIVVGGYHRDFRWNGRGWVSVIYPNAEFNTKGAFCIKTSEFISYCR